MVQCNRETAFTVRCDLSLKEMADKHADERGQSLVEWVRRAMKEKIEREEAEKNMDKTIYCADDGTEFITKQNLIEALRELKKEGFSFENL